MTSSFNLASHSADYSDTIEDLVAVFISSFIVSYMTDSQSMPVPRRDWVGWLPLFFLATVGIFSLFFDLEISNFARHLSIPGDVRKTIHLGETFGHFSGVSAVLITLLVIDLSKRAKLIHAAALTLLSGIVSNAAKYTIPRLRPHSLDNASFHVESIWDTWGTPLSGSWFDEATRSFPSGHSATAVAFAIGLSHVYPRGKWIFAFFAGMACLQRLVSGAHFLSDIMAGSCIALILSYCLDRYAIREVCE